MEIRHLRLPEDLRKDLSQPLGELVTGSPKEVAPVLAKRFSKENVLLICVGDVVSSMLIEEGLKPNLIITDGKTKRSENATPISLEEYDEIITVNPAGEVTEEAWATIKYIVDMLKIQPELKFHLIIEGEEDLLVLPLINELKGVKEYNLVYGQPNTGAVVMSGTLSKTFLIEDIMEKMEIVDDEH